MTRLAALFLVIAAAAPLSASAQHRFKVEFLNLPDLDYDTPITSPDGTQVAYTSRNGAPILVNDGGKHSVRYQTRGEQPLMLEGVNNAGQSLLLKQGTSYHANIDTMLFRGETSGALTTLDHIPGGSDADLGEFSFGAGGDVIYELTFYDLLNVSHYHLRLSTAKGTFDLLNLDSIDGEYQHRTVAMNSKGKSVFAFSSPTDLSSIRKVRFYDTDSSFTEQNLPEAVGSGGVLAYSDDGIVIFQSSDDISTQLRYDPVSGTVTPEKVPSSSNDDSDDIICSTPNSRRVSSAEFVTKYPSGSSLVQLSRQEDLPDTLAIATRARGKSRPPYCLTNSQAKLTVVGACGDNYSRDSDGTLEWHNRVETKGSCSLKVSMAGLSADELKRIKVGTTVDGQLNSLRKLDQHRTATFKIDPANPCGFSVVTPYGDLKLHALEIPLDCYDTPPGQSEGGSEV